MKLEQVSNISTSIILLYLILQVVDTNRIEVKHVSFIRGTLVSGVFHQTLFSSKCCELEFAKL